MLFLNYHRLGKALAEARDIGEKRCRGRVEIDAHGVHRVFHDGFELLRQTVLVDVVLVLADANGFGLDLDELGERVLQAAGNRDGTAQRHVEFRNSRAASSEAE